MPCYSISRKKVFERDFARVTRGDAAFELRVERRIAKLSEDPKHHGYHAGGLLRCNWVAGVGNWAMVYEINDTHKIVTLLRLLSLDEI